MVKHTQTIRRQQLMNYSRVFDHFVGLALIEEKTERLRYVSDFKWSQSPIKLDQKNHESWILLFLRDLLNIKLVKTDGKDTF